MLVQIFLIQFLLSKHLFFFSGFLPKTHITFNLFCKVMQERRQRGSRGGPLTPNDLV